MQDCIIFMPQANCPALCLVHISYTFFEVGILKFRVWKHLGMAECRVLFFGYFDLDLDLWHSF